MRCIVVVNTLGRNNEQERDITNQDAVVDFTA